MGLLRAPPHLSPFLSAMVKKVFRPSLQDVEKLAKGLASKKRGLGSRGVPHRLNSDEWDVYERASKFGFAVVKGSGHRRERKGSPLLNTLRQRADALAKPLVWVEQGCRAPATHAASTCRLYDSSMPHRSSSSVNVPARSPSRRSVMEHMRRKSGVRLSLRLHLRS